MPIKESAVKAVLRMQGMLNSSRKQVRSNFENKIQIGFMFSKIC